MDIDFSLNDPSFWIALAILVVVLLATAVLSFFLIYSITALRGRSQAPALAAAGAKATKAPTEASEFSVDPFAPLVREEHAPEDELYDPMATVSPFEEALPLEDEFDSPLGYDPAFPDPPSMEIPMAGAAVGTDLPALLEPSFDSRSAASHAPRQDDEQVQALFGSGTTDAPLLRSTAEPRDSFSSAALPPPTAAEQTIAMSTTAVGDPFAASANYAVGEELRAEPIALSDPAPPVEDPTSVPVPEAPDPGSPPESSLASLVATPLKAPSDESTESPRFPTDILGREPIRAAHAAAQASQPGKLVAAASPLPSLEAPFIETAPVEATPTEAQKVNAPVAAPLPALAVTTPPSPPALTPLPEPEALNESPPLSVTSDPHSGFVAAGVRVHYLEWGSSDKPTIILIHGLTGNAHNYDALAQQVSAWYQLIAIDLRGHGDSAWHPDHDYRLSSYVRDLDKLISALKLRTIALVGTALGADIALAYAGARPAVVGRLILNDSGPDVNRVGSERIRRYIEEAPQSFKSMSDANSWWRKNYPVLRDYDDNVLQTFVECSVRRQDDGSFAWKFDPVFRRLAGHPQLRDVDLWASASLVRTPTMIVRGADSDILSVGVAGRLRDTIAEAQLVEVPNVGHAPSLVEPEVLPVLRRFLQ